MEVFVYGFSQCRTWGNCLEHRLCVGVLADVTVYCTLFETGEIYVPRRVVNSSNCGEIQFECLVVHEHTVYEVRDHSLYFFCPTGR